MKKFKKALPALALLAMLSGCSAQNGLPPVHTQPSTQQMDVDAAPMLEMMEGAKEVTIPAREVKETQKASDEAPTIQYSTEPVQTGLPDTPPEIEQPAISSAETESQETESPPAVPKETAPPETSPPTTQNAEIVSPTPEQTQTEDSEGATTPEVQPIETVPPETAGEAPETAALDIAALESYARSYAQSLGFTIDYSLGQGNGGYYPALDYPINSMEQGYSVVCGCVSSLKEQLVAADGTGEFAPYRYNCKIEYLYSDEYGDWYLFWDFYG